MQSVDFVISQEIPEEEFSFENSRVAGCHGQQAARQSADSVNGPRTLKMLKAAEKLVQYIAREITAEGLGVEANEMFTTVAEEASENFIFQLKSKISSILEESSVCEKLNLLDQLIREKSTDRVQSQSVVDSCVTPLLEEEAVRFKETKESLEEKIVRLSAERDGLRSENEQQSAELASAVKRVRSFFEALSAVKGEEMRQLMNRV